MYHTLLHRARRARSNEVQEPKLVMQIPHKKNTCLWSGWSGKFGLVFGPQGHKYHMQEQSSPVEMHPFVTMPDRNDHDTTKECDDGASPSRPDVVLRWPYTHRRDGVRCGREHISERCSGEGGKLTSRISRHSRNRMSVDRIWIRDPRSADFVTASLNLGSDVPTRKRRTSKNLKSRMPKELRSFAAPA
jgi:hypothetical protein